MPKPVIFEIIGKNGDSRVEFYPTPRMIIWAQCKCENMHMSESEVSKEIGMGHATFKNWERKYHKYFREWLEEAMDQFGGYDTKKAKLLENVGMIEALQGNYQFWKDMARTHGVIKEEKGQEVKIQIGRDLSTLSGKDLEDERGRILSEIRGLEYSGGSQVAQPSSEEGQESMGSGAGSMSEESLALDNSLGGDRGRPE